MIEVRDLVKDYGAFRALNGITFSLKKGEIVGFLGPNGAGKSTTMKVLTGFIAHDGGTATVDGFDVIEQSIEVRRRIGYLPENTPLYEEMGVVEFLEYIAELRRIPRARRAARMKEVIDMCGLGWMTGKLIGELSRGYRQRVGLAQALIHDPPILIMDEPTSALDPTQVVEIRDLVRELGRQKSILLSTHIMGEVVKTCNRVLIISKGRVVAEGPPDGLANAPGQRPTIILEVRAAESEAAALLGSLKPIEAVESLPSGSNGVARLRLRIREGAGDVREAVHEALRPKGWPMRELREERASLEEYFIRVTTQG